jgi:hypothetical protein
MIRNMLQRYYLGPVKPMVGASTVVSVELQTQYSCAPIHVETQRK